VKLLEEPEFQSWWPAPEAVRPFIDELAAARESPLVVSPAAQEERVRQTLRQAARTLSPPALLARWLEGTAYVLAETGRLETARQALAVAVELRARPDHAADIPFVVALAERAVGRLLAAETARQENAQKGSLLVTPAQFLKERSSSRSGRTQT